MLKLRCSKHPRYGGKREPRRPCGICDRLYAVRLNSLADRILEVVESGISPRNSEPDTDSPVAN